jgi:hypothetical protein
VIRMAQVSGQSCGQAARTMCRVSGPDGTRLFMCVGNSGCGNFTLTAAMSAQPLF